jgi:hypothetical protein
MPSDRAATAIGTYPMSWSKFEPNTFQVRVNHYRYVHQLNAILFNYLFIYVLNQQLKGQLYSKKEKKTNKRKAYTQTEDRTKQRLLFT